MDPPGTPFAEKYGIQGLQSSLHYPNRGPAAGKPPAERSLSTALSAFHFASHRLLGTPSCIQTPLPLSEFCGQDRLRPSPEKRRQHAVFQSQEAVVAPFCP